MGDTHSGQNLQAGHPFLQRHTVFVLHCTSKQSHIFIPLGPDPRENGKGEQGQGFHVEKHNHFLSYNAQNYPLKHSSETAADLWLKKIYAYR